MDHWSLTMRAFRAPWHPSDVMDEKGSASHAETGRVIDRRDSSRGTTPIPLHTKLAQSRDEERYFLPGLDFGHLDQNVFGEPPFTA